MPNWLRRFNMDITTSRFWFHPYLIKYPGWYLSLSARDTAYDSFVILANIGYGFRLGFTLVIHGQVTKRELKIRYPSHEELMQASKESIEENIDGFLYLADR